MSFAKKIVGMILVLVGVTGVFLPLMPGVIFIVLGSALLGSNHRLVVRVTSMVREHWSRDKPDFPKAEQAKAKNHEHSNSRS